MLTPIVKVPATLETKAAELYQDRYKDGYRYIKGDDGIYIRKYKYISQAQIQAQAQAEQTQIQAQAEQTQIQAQAEQIQAQAEQTQIQAQPPSKFGKEPPLFTCQTTWCSTCKNKKCMEF
jgi:multidrug efflux pump subunit AcrA (membrane-fusion protein)